MRRASKRSRVSSFFVDNDKWFVVSRWFIHDHRWWMISRTRCSAEALFHPMFKRTSQQIQTLRRWIFFKLIPRGNKNGYWRIIEFLRPTEGERKKKKRGNPGSVDFKCDRMMNATTVSSYNEQRFLSSWPYFTNRFIVWFFRSSYVDRMPLRSSFVSDRCFSLFAYWRRKNERLRDDRWRSSNAISWWTIVRINHQQQFQSYSIIREEHINSDERKAKSSSALQTSDISALYHSATTFFTVHSTTIRFG